MSQLMSGQPEDQLRGPFETLMTEAAQVFGLKAVCTGETPLPDKLGRPDYGEQVRVTPNLNILGLCKPSDLHLMNI